MAEEGRSPDVVNRFVDRLAELSVPLSESTPSSSDMTAQPSALNRQDHLVAPSPPEPLGTAIMAGSSALLESDGATAVLARQQDPSRKAPQPAKTDTKPTRTVKIDLHRLSRQSFISPLADEKTLLSEEFRIIKRPLIQSARANGDNALANANMILVTSAATQEGKTFTSVNLALSMASERDLHILLVDADPYTQSVLHTLGLPPSKGLMDLLVDENAQIPDFLLRTNISNLSILPAGTRHPQATELISSQRMADLARDMSQRYSDRIIIMDSPPILACTEAAALGALVGQIVMVVEYNRTSTREVERALSLLNTRGNIGFVLNKSTDRFAQHNYHAYGYSVS